MTAKDELHRLIDELPETQMETARQLLEELGSASDDDPLSSEDMAEIEAGRNAMRRGEYITLDEYRRKRGL